MPYSYKGMSKKDTAGVFCWINSFGLLYFWTSVLIFFSVTYFIYIPSLYHNEPELLQNRKFMSIFLLLQVLTNYFLCIFKNSYFDSTKCTIIPNSKWGKCLECNELKPPRTHHCPSCKRCVLKRDHHCFLTASCIGFRNLRYSIVYCLYSALASGYTLYFAFGYMKHIYTPITWENWHHFVLPYAAIEYLFGQKTLTFVLHIAMVYCSAITMVCGMGMSGMQMIFSLFNMTQRDVQQGRMPDLKSMPHVCEEMRRIFGPWFLINFIFPLFWLSPKGDGIHLSDSDGDKLI